MLDIIEKRRKEKERLIKRAREFIQRARKFGRISVILYGSVARGDFNVWSDIDLIVVAEKFPESMLRRQDVLLTLKVPKIEPKGYTKEEFEKMIRLKSPFIKILKKEGIFILDELNLKRLMLK